jgi:magnesium transporter
MTAATIMISRFESIIADNISLAFFLPVIVYMSDAVGTQTETIFVRDLADRRANFYKYLWREILVGLCIGMALGVLLYVVAGVWLGQSDVAAVVGWSMFINVAIAPVTALFVSQMLFKRRVDPALGAGPFSTVVQDMVSLIVYFVVASLVMGSLSLTG